MYDQPIIVADPTHLAISMMVERMKVNKRIETTKELDKRRAVLIAGIESWCQTHQVTIEWSASPGRRTRKHLYRIAYAGDNLDAQNPEALYDALNAEILRLMQL